jgi:NAD(P)-dependent dehydrogenase (short-subunit alcohol dehydrogenase family)
MKHFLVTGCSTGIGAACALDLAARGHRVFAGVRRDVDGERLRSLLPAEPPGRHSAGASTSSLASDPSTPADRVIPVRLDVTSPAAIAAACQEVELRLKPFQADGLDGVVNNAGILVPGPLELLSTDDLRRQFDVNVFGVHAVTRAFLPMLRPTRGRLVLVGSISGVVTPPFMGAYAASKHALEAMADAFRMELRPWRLPVSLIQPDSVATPIWDKMAAGTETTSPASGSSVAQVYQEQLQQIGAAARWMGQTGMALERVLKSLRHALLARWPRSRYRVGLRTHLALWAYPRLANRLFDLFMLSAMGLGWRRPAVPRFDS